MSRNGSGVYNLPAGNPVVSGTTITASWANNTMNDIASALTGSLAADGQTPATGNLNMANNRITTMADPSGAQDAATKAYVDAKTDGTSAGSFTNLAYTGTLTGGTGVVNIGSGQVYKDASGNVGIGTTSPATKLDVQSATCIPKFTSTTGTNSVYAQMVNTGGNFYTGIDNSTGATSGAAYGRFVYGDGAYPMLFFTNSAERMRITSGGDLSVGLTGTSGRVTIRGETSDSTKYTFFTEAQDGTDQLAVRCDGAVYMGLDGASPYNLITATAANATLLSDGFFYRSTSSIKYKKDVEDATHGLAEVMQLRPVTYKGKSAADGNTVFGGLIAEEVDAIGLKEFVQYAEDGSPDALAYGNMVSLLAKAIQEQQAMIEELKQEVAALKGAAQ